MWRGVGHIPRCPRAQICATCRFDPTGGILTACHWCFFRFTTPSALTGRISRSLGGHNACFRVDVLFHVDLFTCLYISPKTNWKMLFFKYQCYGGPQRRREPKFWFSSGISSFVKNHRNHLITFIYNHWCHHAASKSSYKNFSNSLFLFFFTWNPYFHRFVCWFWFHPSKASDDLGTLLRSKFCEPKPLLHAGSLKGKRWRISLGENCLVFIFFLGGGAGGR